MHIPGLDRWLTTPPDDDNEFEKFVDAVCELIPEHVWEKNESRLEWFFTHGWSVQKTADHLLTEEEAENEE